MIAMMFIVQEVCNVAASPMPCCSLWWRDAPLAHTGPIATATCTPVLSSKEGFTFGLLALQGLSMRALTNATGWLLLPVLTAPTVLTHFSTTHMSETSMQSQLGRNMAAPPALCAHSTQHQSMLVLNAIRP